MPTLKTERRMKAIRKIALIVIMFGVALVALSVRWGLPEAFLAVLSWLSGLDPQAKVTLAGTIITSFVGLVSAFLVGWFQHQRVKAESEIKIHDQVLIRLQEIAIKHHMPALSAASSLHRSLKEALDAKSLESEQIAFYWYCKFSRLITDFAREYGGFMLKDFSAEELVGRLSFNIQSAPVKYLTASGISAIGVFFERDTRLVDFKKEIAPGGRLAWQFEKFRQWLYNEEKSVQEVVRYAKCYAEVMAYELNIIYKPFYGVEPPEPSSDCLYLARKLVPKYRKSSLI